MNLRVQTIVVTSILTTVLSACGGSSGSGSSDDGGGVNQTVPPPSNLQASGRHKSVDLSWSPVGGAGSYAIYSASEPDVDRSSYQSLADGNRTTATSTSGQVTDLSNQTTYFFTVAAIVGGSEGPVSSEISAVPRVQDPAPLSRARAEHAAAVIDGQILVAGGFDGGYIDDVSIYDPNADEWNAAPPIVRRRGLAASTLNGQVYAIAGRTKSASGQIGNLDIVETFDPVAGTWGRVADLPASPWTHSSAVVGNELFVILSDVNKYVPTTNTWSRAGTAPNSGGHASTVVNGKIYITGGSGGPSGSAKTLSIYDPDSETATVGASLPLGRDGHAAVTINDKVYLFGGERIDSSGAFSFLTQVSIYDPSSDLWTVEDADLKGRTGLVAVELDGRAFLIGGYNGAYLSDVTIYKPAD